MADWQGMARSNYFMVKDAAAFTDWLKTVRDLHVSADRDDGRFMVWSDEGWPTTKEDDDELEDFDFVDELLRQVRKGEVVILMDINHDKARYVSGIALAYRAGHDHQIKLSLNDIYDLAETQWPDAQVTRAEY